jgi:hypothetical protein
MKFLAELRPMSESPGEIPQHTSRAGLPPEAVAAERHTSLVPLETTVGFFAELEKNRGASTHADLPKSLPAADPHQQFVHGGAAGQRAAVYASLVRTHQPVHRCQAFARCQELSSCWVESRPSQSEQIMGGPLVSPPEEFRVRGSSCHDRLCPHCSTNRAWDIRLALFDFLKPKKLRFVTLTLKSKTTDRLAERLDELYKCFRYLRASRVWEECVTGGVAFLEITRGKQRDRWHVHLHLLVEGKFIPQAELSATWCRITKGSFRVDVRPVNDQGGVNYVTKYATKALNSDLLASDDCLDEAVMGLKGRRLCFCFGDWYGTPLSTLMENDTDDNAAAARGGWTKIVPLSDFCRLAAGGRLDYLAALGSTPFGKFLAQPDSS